MLNEADTSANGPKAPNAANSVNSTAFDEQETADGQAVGTETLSPRPLVQGAGRTHTIGTSGANDANDSYNGSRLNNGYDAARMNDGVNPSSANDRVQPRPAFDTPSTANGYPVDNNTSHGASADERSAQQHLFGLLDTDSNGRLTRNEIMHDRALARDMSRIDRNHDGVLSYDEFSSYRS
ncbi:MAG: EF-hand domain-containing protein [Rudaea sp.]